ncbi:hypothetical protein L6452_08300 [Arctium lappa]|uniref:Uncharacterized protein n=1 Tax=Arctium lappa TaxID=4217 RepID=A0ACB9DGX3_ARCLA|nr:hypothetical protein L6452_08300 [Arctium lappa]
MVILNREECNSSGDLPTLFGKGTSESVELRKENVSKFASHLERAMINEGKSNLILVSGESGTVQSNPVLEAFDNAKTVRNYNSREKSERKLKGCILLLSLVTVKHLDGKALNKPVCEARVMIGPVPDYGLINDRRLDCSRVIDLICHMEA